MHMSIMDSTLISIHQRIYKWEAVTAIFSFMSFVQVLTYVTWEWKSGGPIPIAPELLFFLLVTFAFTVFSSMMTLTAFIVTMWPEERDEKLHKSLFEVLIRGFGAILYFLAFVVVITYLFWNPAEKELTLDNVTFIVPIMFSIYNTVGYTVTCYASEKSRRMMLLNKSSLLMQVEVDQTV